MWTVLQTRINWRVKFWWSARGIVRGFISFLLRQPPGQRGTVSEKSHQKSQLHFVIYSLLGGAFFIHIITSSYSCMENKLFGTIFFQSTIWSMNFAACRNLSSGVYWKCMQNIHSSPIYQLSLLGIACRCAVGNKSARLRAWRISLSTRGLRNYFIELAAKFENYLFKRWKGPFSLAEIEWSCECEWMRPPFYSLLKLSAC